MSRLIPSVALASSMLLLASSLVIASPDMGVPPPEEPTGARQDIDDCCAGLEALKSPGHGKDTKRRAAIAAKICHSLAPVVRSRQRSRESALTSIRAQLAGVQIPGACR